MPPLPSGEAFTRDQHASLENVAAVLFVAILFLVAITLGAVVSSMTD